MDKDEENICKKVLRSGMQTCDEERAQADNYKLKKELWAENDKKIRASLDKLKRLKHIDMPNKKKE